MPDLFQVRVEVFCFFFNMFFVLIYYTDFGFHQWIAITLTRSNIFLLAQYIEGLPRICQMLHLPLVTLRQRLSNLCTESECEFESDVSSTSTSISGTVLLAMRCWNLATRTLALVSAGCVEAERLPSLTAPLTGGEEITGLLEAWRTVNATYDLLCMWVLLRYFLFSLSKTCCAKVEVLPSASHM